MKTQDNARREARDALLQAGYYAGQHIDQTGYDIAASAYIRSLIRDGDVGYLVELFSENSDANLLKLYSLIAQSIQDRTVVASDAVGEYLGNIIGSYLENEIAHAVDGLPSLADLMADDYDEDYHRELRATA